MHQASVGVHCPECFKGNKQKVYRRSNLPNSQGVVTQAIIAINIVAFLVQMLVYDAEISTGVTYPEQAIAPWYLRAFEIGSLGEWWRVFTSGFGHFGMFHLGMNMYALYQLGRAIERLLGPRRFALAYLTSMVGGSLGALVIDQGGRVMGASGAIFGLFGLMVAMLRSRGIGIQQAGLVPIIVINVVITFSGYVSIGGHVGGFIVGFVLGAMYFGMQPGARPVFGRDQNKADAATLALGAALFVACLVAANAAI